MQPTDLKFDSIHSLKLIILLSFSLNRDPNPEKDYYNDLPGKLPPEFLNPDPVEDIPAGQLQPLKEKNHLFQVIFIRFFSFAIFPI